MDFSSLNPATSNSLNIAARNNNVKTVKRLLKKINVNCTDNRGWTCLHEAAANDSFQCLKLILENEDVRPLVETHEGHTALYLACRFKSSIKTIKYLLDTAPDIANYGSNEGVTPMHIACSQGNIELIQLLVHYGAIIDVQDFDGDTPLHDAILSSQYEVIATLLHAGADPEIRNAQELTAFHLVCFNGCLQILNIIFPFVIDINQLAGNGNSPLILAAQGSNDEIVKFLLENGGDPHTRNKDGAIALTVALYVGHLPTFKLLLNVTDINKMDHNIILTACMENYFKIGILESLLMLDLDPEFFNYNTPFNFNPEYVGLCAQVYLTNAPINIYLKICEYIYLKSRDKFQQFFYLFLMRGLSVDAIDVNECPPLVYIHYCMHSACFSDVFQILREHGCNVDYKSSFFTRYRKRRCLPDAFFTSVFSDPSTSLVMLPYSLYCDPEYLLAKICKVGLLGRMSPDVIDKWLSMIHEDLRGINPETISCCVLTLKHLCRQKIRSTIISSSVEFIDTNKFLDILQTLKLPKHIQEYLRFM